MSSMYTLHRMTTSNLARCLHSSVKIQVEVFWVVMSYNVVVRCQRFRGQCCL